MIILNIIEAKKNPFFFREDVKIFDIDFIADISAIRGGGLDPTPAKKKSKNVKKYSACPEYFFIVETIFLQCFVFLKSGLP